jgi:hypothetical protein
MFKEDEIKQLKAVFVKLTRPVGITLYQRPESEFGKKLESFVDAVCRLSEGKCIAVSGDPTPELIAMPCIKIGALGHADIVYAALPAGHQFAPFLKILEVIGGSGSPVFSGSLSPDSTRAELMVLISDSCPRCPRVVETVGLLACRNLSVAACVVDAGQFPDLAVKHGVRSVPATVLDRKIVTVGAVSEDRMMDLIESRGTPRFEMEVVRSLIELAQIKEAAGYMNRDAGRAVVLDLLKDPEFSKRLSALVVMEKALEDNPAAVREMAPLLFPMLSHADARIRGDVADLLGKIGDPQAIARLEPLVSDPDPDVAEAAAEAIEELKKNS